MENKYLGDSFPLDSFPKQISGAIIEYETHKNFDRNPAALSILVCAAAITEMGTYFEINDEEQPPIIWGNIIQSQGSGKSHLLNHYMSFLFRKNAELHQNPETKHTYVTKNTTIEGMLKHHNGNRKGIMMFKDELPSFVKGINNYQSGGAKEEWMSSWNGGDFTITRSESKYFIPEIKPNLFGGSQPEKQHVLFDVESMGDGFANRFLNTTPYDTTPKKKKSRTKAKNLMLFIEKDILEPIWNLEVRTYYASKEADEFWLTWTDKMTEEYGETMFDLYKEKLFSYSIRISGILHLLHIADYKTKNDTYNLPLEIPLHIIKKAIDICKFFMKQYAEMLGSLNTQRFPSIVEKELNMKLPLFQTNYKKLSNSPMKYSEIVNYFIGKPYKVDNIKRQIIDKGILFEKNAKTGLYAKTLSNE
ncbi:MAG: DUF3987 domain-containing protein [Crocinitomicaceae bacterium]